MSSNNDHPPRLPVRRPISGISGRSWSFSREFTEKYDFDSQPTNDNLDTSPESLVSNDVPIPAGILRAANRARNGPLNADDEEKIFPQQTGNPEDFSVLDIAREQRQHGEEALNDIEAERAHLEHHGRSDLETGNRRDQWESSNLATLEEGEQLEATATTSRWSARRSMPARAYSNNSVQLRRSASNNSARRELSALPASSRNDAVLYRSLNNFTLRDPSRTGGRPLSEVPPDADYVGIFDDPQDTDTELSTTTATRPSLDKTTAEPDDGRIERARKATLARLCMRDRNESVIGPAVKKVKQGATDLAHRNSLIEVYEKAKLRGEHLQRKRWVQLVFEYTCYVLILCFVYFVLVGRPIWNGAVWWLYWVFANKFSVAGTWSVLIGMAFL